MNKVAFVARTEAVHGLSNIDIHSQGQPGYSHCSVPNLPASESNTDFNVVPFLRWLASHLVIGDYTEVLPHWKGQCFVLNGVNTLDTDLPFLYASLLPKLPPMDSQNALSIVLVFHTTLLLFKELIEQMKWWIAHAGGNHWSCSVPHRLEAASLEQCNGPLNLITVSATIAGLL